MEEYFLIPTQLKIPILNKTHCQDDNWFCEYLAAGYEPDGTGVYICLYAEALNRDCELVCDDKDDPYRCDFCLKSTIKE